jgi:hypothetical protein
MGLVQHVLLVLVALPPFGSCNTLVSLDLPCAIGISLLCFDCVWCSQKVCEYFALRTKVRKDPKP